MGILEFYLAKTWGLPHLGGTAGDLLAIFIYNVMNKLSFRIHIYIYTTYIILFICYFFFDLYFDVIYISIFLIYCILYICCSVCYILRSMYFTLFDFVALQFFCCFTFCRYHIDICTYIYIYLLL